jgi:hypothetical protein
MLRLLFTLLLVLTTSSLLAEERKNKWQGVIHLGDSPEAYEHVASAGLAFQVPLVAEPSTKAKLTITTADVQTRQGEGHYAELYAHFQVEGGPAKEVWVDTFRLKELSTGDDKEHVFEFDSGQNLAGQRPDYYSLRLKIDTSLPFSLWDDFLVKRILLEP